MSLRDRLLATMFEPLDEAVNRFPEVPNTWKKIAVANGIKAGAGSEVEVIFRKGKINDAKGLETQLRKLPSLAKNYPVVWIEIGGQELVAVFHDTRVSERDSKYRVQSAEGADAMIQKSYRLANTGNYVGGKYVAPRYHQWEAKEMGADQAFYAAYRMIGEMAKSVFPDAKDQEDAIDEFVKGKEVLIKGLAEDKNRLATSASRRDARRVDNSQDVLVRKRAFERVLDQRIGDLVSYAMTSSVSRADVVAAVESAKDGKYKPISVDATQINKVNELLKAISRVASSDYDYKASRWNSESNASLGWAAKELFAALDVTR